MAEIDNLQIKISADANTASTAIDRLVNKLETLSNSLGRLDTKGLQRFSSGISILGTSMKSLENVKLPDYTRLAKGIQKFNDIDGAKLGAISSGLRPLADSVRLFSNVNFDNKNLSSFINSITRLANSNLGNLTSVNFSGFTNQMSGLIASLSNAGEVSRYTTNFINSIAKLATVGGNIQIVAQDLPILRSSLLNFVNTMAGAGAVSQETVSFTTAIAQLANAGDKAAVTAGNLDVLANELKKFFQTISTAPNVSRNIIDMTNALANLANQGSRVGSASRSIVRGMNNTTTSMNRARKSTTSLAAAFGKFYATWFLAIRGAKKFVEAIEGTADYIEAYNYYNVALGKIASEWNQDWEKYGYQNAEAYANSFTERLNASLSKLSGLQIDENQNLLVESGMKNLGLNIQEITQYASQLASVTNSIGQTGEVSIAASSAFTKLAGDISSLFNIDFSSAAQNLQSGLIGQSRALYKYGIDITNATLQTYAYNLGLTKSVSEMTQAEKMQLRMIAILDQSRVSWGDLANTINSPSNMLRQFTNNVKEAGMVLGQLFIPVLQKIMPIVNGVVIAIKRLLVSIAQLLGVKLDLDSFGQGYTDLSDGFDDMADSLDGVSKSAKKAKAGIREFDELKVINMPETGGGGTGGGGGAIDLTDEILKATEEYERVWQEAYDRMANKAQDFADKVSKALEPVRKIFEDFAIGDFFQAGQDTSHLVASIFNFFADAINKVDWYGIGQKIGDFFAGIDWLSILSSVGRFIWEAVTGALELWTGIFDAAPIETAILSAIGLLSFATVGTTIAGKISSVLALNTPSIVPKILIAGVEFVVVFDLAKELMAKIFPEDSEWYKDFTWFGDEGFFSYISDDWSITWDAITDMLTDWDDQPLRTALANLIAGPLVSAFAIDWKKVIGNMWINLENQVIGIIPASQALLWNLAADLNDFLADIFSGLGLDSVSGFFMGIADNLRTSANWVIETFNKWFIEPIRNLFGIHSPSKLFEDFGKYIILGFKNGIYSLINEVIDIFKYIVRFTKDILSGINTWLSERLFSDAGSSIQNFLNSIISGFNTTFNFIIERINNVLKGLNNILGFNFSGINLNANIRTKDVRIKGYAAGGYVPKSYSLFMAGENHIPEMLGTVGGKTAVAGGAEITGIRDAVWNAHNEEMELMRQQNELLRGILSKEFGITEQQIGKAAANYSRDYMRRTGNPAYSF